MSDGNPNSAPAKDSLNAASTAGRRWRLWSLVGCSAALLAGLIFLGLHMMNDGPLAARSSVTATAHGSIDMTPTTIRLKASPGGEPGPSYEWHLKMPRAYFTSVISGVHYFDFTAETGEPASIAFERERHLPAAARTFSTIGIKLLGIRKAGLSPVLEEVELKRRMRCRLVPSGVDGLLVFALPDGGAVAGGSCGFGAQPWYVPLGTQPRYDLAITCKAADIPARVSDACLVFGYEFRGWTVDIRFDEKALPRWRRVLHLTDRFLKDHTILSTLGKPSTEVRGLTDGGR